MDRVVYGTPVSPQARTTTGIVKTAAVINNHNLRIYLRRPSATPPSLLGGANLPSERAITSRAPITRGSTLSRYALPTFSIDIKPLIIWFERDCASTLLINTSSVWWLLMTREHLKPVSR